MCWWGTPYIGSPYLICNLCSFISSVDWPCSPCWEQHPPPPPRLCKAAPDPSGQAPTVNKLDRAPTQRLRKQRLLSGLDEQEHTMVQFLRKLVSPRFHLQLGASVYFRTVGFINKWVLLVSRIRLDHLENKFPSLDSSFLNLLLAATRPKQWINVKICVFTFFPIYLGPHLATLMGCTQPTTGVWNALTFADMLVSDIFKLTTVGWMSTTRLRHNTCSHPSVSHISFI